MYTAVHPFTNDFFWGITNLYRGLLGKVSTCVILLRVLSAVPQGYNL